MNPVLLAASVSCSSPRADVDGDVGDERADQQHADQPDNCGAENQQLAFDAIDHLRHEQGADRIADRADRQEQDRATRTSAVPTDQFGCIAKESIVAGVP